MGDITVTDPIVIKSIDSVAPLTIAAVNNIAPVTIAKVEKIAPAAVHIKELNHIDPLMIESARIDAFRNIDPLRVDRLNVTTLPVVNLSVNQVPAVDLSVRRLPPVAIGVNQSFDMPSDYTARARFLGFEVLRVRIQGCTRVVPQDCVRREQAHAHERSFPDVAAVGNPAIPNQRIACSTETVACGPPASYSQPAKLGPARNTLNAGPPRFRYAAAPKRPGVRSG